MHFIKSLRLGMLLLLAAQLCAQAQNLSDGLVAYYPFNGNANDATGNGHDGVVLGAMLTTNRFGQQNAAYAFNGSNTCIVVTNSADLQLTNDFSLSVWAQFPTNPTTYLALFSKHYNNANASGWIFEVVANNGSPLLEFQAANLFDTSSPQAPIASGSWFHAAFTFQRSSGTCNLYINGNLVDSRVRNYNYNQDPNPLVFGAQRTSNSASGFHNYFNGVMDDVRFYNRVLTSNEVQQLYTQTSLDEGLLAYYPFNGSAVDATGNGHDGVAIGATLTTDRFGAANRAYAFNGSNNIIVVSNSAAFQLTNDFALSVWAEFPTNPTTYLALFTKHYNDANASGWIFEVVANNGAPLLEFQGANLFDTASPQTPIMSNTWFHAAFTFERSSGICNLYINGNLVDSRVRSYNYNEDPNPLVFGAEPTYNSDSGYQNYFNGVMDDVRFYNRVISSNEVQTLYADRPVAMVAFTKAARLDFSWLRVGTNYQLQVSSDLVNWFNQGAPFAATSSTFTEYVDVGDWNSAYWRLQVVP